MKKVSSVTLALAVVGMLMTVPESVLVVAQKTTQDGYEATDADRGTTLDEVMNVTTTVAPITTAPVATPKPFCNTEAPIHDVTGKPISLKPVYISVDALKYTEAPVTLLTAIPTGKIPDERRNLR
jgi:hypothetical protein